VESRFGRKPEVIHFDVVYYRPESVAEAVAAFEEARERGLDPLYLAGGTEITTFSRQGKIRPGALIDLKKIPECNLLDTRGEELVLGAALPLNRVIEAGVFPLLSQTAACIADYTTRNRLSLGGNIAGRLPYREAVLPFLACDARFVFAGPNGTRTVDCEEAFAEHLRAQAGEFLLQILVENRYLTSPFFHRRRERGGRIDYPLVTLVLLRTGREIRCAVSGLCSAPRRIGEIEALLSDRTRPAGERAAAAIDAFPVAIRSDFRASADYRRHLFGLALDEGLHALEEW